MKQLGESYGEQLERVRRLSQDTQPWDLSLRYRLALKAVLQHYDAFAAVVAAANQVAKYDDFGEELSPGEELIAPRDPTAMNEARMRLHEALAVELCREVA